MTADAGTSRKLRERERTTRAATMHAYASMVGWLCGYAVGRHGTAARDFDLIAVPWEDKCPDGAPGVEPPAELAKRLAAGLGGLVANEEGEPKPHGRVAFTIVGPGLPWEYIDLSVITPQKQRDRGATSGQALGAGGAP